MVAGKDIRFIFRDDEGRMFRGNVPLDNRPASLTLQDSRDCEGLSFTLPDRCATAIRLALQTLNDEATLQTTLKAYEGQTGMVRASQIAELAGWHIERDRWAKSRWFYDPSEACIENWKAANDE